MNAGKAFFGSDRMDFSVVRIAPNVPNVTRDYHRLTDVVDDTIDARVLQGIHFRSADVQGARIGRQVAEWVDDQRLPTRRLLAISAAPRAASPLSVRHDDRPVERAGVRRVPHVQRWARRSAPRCRAPHRRRSRNDDHVHELPARVARDDRWTFLLAKGQGPHGSRSGRRPRGS